MRTTSLIFRFPISALRNIVAILCALAMAPGDSCAYALPYQEAAPAQANPQQQEAAKLPKDQLDSLVAPIALYPDPLLSQTLVASTYPLEIVQLQQWLAKNKGLKDKALADAAMKQGWDPSVQALAALPDVVKSLSENIKWTTDLGNAFLAQQSDVMEAVQRMRAKAQEKGALKSGEQQKVETKVIESKQVIVIEPAQPDVVYVPSYNPVVVYGAPVYPYPPVYYPPAGYYAAGMAVSFGVGMAMGAAWGGGYGWGAGWGGNNVYVNRNNTFVSNSNRNYRGGVNGNTNWQHNPQHRGGAPYPNRATANTYGGTARGESMQSRQANASQRQSSANTSTANMRNTAGTGANNTSATRGSGERAASREPSSGGSSRSSSAFSGSSSMSGSSARASSQRGASSMSSRGGGGGGGRRGGGRR